MTTFDASAKIRKATEFVVPGLAKVSGVRIQNVRELFLPLRRSLKVWVFSSELRFLARHGCVIRDILKREIEPYSFSYVFTMPAFQSKRTLACIDRPGWPYWHIQNVPLLTPVS
jgi:hypothetical protein